MIANPLATSARDTRWGEKLLIAAIAPGAFAGLILSMYLAFVHFRWEPDFGPFATLFAYAAISTPLLTMLGSLTLVAAALFAPFVPGRPKYKWGLLILGTLAWGAAFHWLHVPGLIELP